MTHEYKTDDTYFSAVLMALGKPLLDVEVVDGVVSFYFNNDDGEIDDISRKYDFKNLKIDAKTLAMSIKEQKKRVAEIMRELGK